MTEGRTVVRMTKGKTTFNGQRDQDVRRPHLPKTSTRCFSLAIKSKVMEPEAPGIARAVKSSRSVRK
jgi:hypothetical protein